MSIVLLVTGGALSYAGAGPHVLAAQQAVLPARAALAARPATLRLSRAGRVINSLFLALSRRPARGG